MIDALNRGRSLTVCFVRNSEHDDQDAKVRFSGYDILWPDGASVDVGLKQFCQFGVRTLFGRKSFASNLITMHLLPVASLESELPKLPRGVRSRRFCLRRRDDEGIVTLLDGTPTGLVFNLSADDERVIRWVGLRDIDDNSEQWYDIVILPIRQDNAEEAALANGESSRRLDPIASLT